MNKITAQLIATATFGLLVSSLAVAQPTSSQEIWHGWMNLTPCSKTEWTNDGAFETPSLTVRSGPQELHGYLTLNLPNEQTVLSVAKSCADKGVAAAGVAAVLTNWGGAWPAFKATFDKCVNDSGKNIVSNIIQFRNESICKY